jgi:diguanylate cyclase (GGDEF)-like protein/PAS domain S-box-containing protein
MPGSHEQPKVLITCDDASLITVYTNVLAERFPNLDAIPLDAPLLLDSKTAYDLIIIDVSKKSSFRHLQLADSGSPFLSKAVLISPFSTKELSHYFEHLTIFDIVLTKPIQLATLLHRISTIDEEIRHHYLLKSKNEVLVNLINNNQAEIAIFDPEGTLYFANESYMKARAISFEQIDTAHYNDLTGQSDDFYKIKARCKSHASAIKEEYRPDNDLWFRCSHYLIGNYLVQSCEDFTEAIKVQQRLEQAAVFFEHANEGIIITDAHARILAINTAFAKITGYTEEEVIGQTPAMLQSGMHDDHFYAAMWSSLGHNHLWQGEIWNKRKNGEIYPEWLSISAIKPDGDVNDRRFIAIFTDISSLKEADQKAYYHANHDHLTGLSNRINFMSRFRHSIEIASRKNNRVGLFFIDVDKFKEINDTYGHSVGDKILIAIAERLRSNIRAEDSLARFGGDEFNLVMHQVNEHNDVETMAQKLLETIRRPITIDGKVFFITLSIGIATYPDDGRDLEELVKNADTAMYHVKQEGRNGYKLYHRALSEKLQKEVTLREKLRRAIDDECFEVYYQPVIDFKRDECCGAEALVRWKDPEQGMIMPDEFIRIAEENNMIEELSWLIYNQALNMLSVIVKERPKFTMALNVSAHQFFISTFADELITLCSQYDVLPSSIELEITESQLMQSSEVASKAIKRLNESGFNIAIDDFGTGYSSLSYLKHFRLQKLKIDKSFVLDMPQDNDDQMIVETIVSIARTLGYSVHAEGVETQEHHRLCSDLACDFGQGYHYSKPLSADDFIAYLDLKAPRS